MIASPTIDPILISPPTIPVLLLASQIRVQKTIWKRGNLDEISKMLKTKKAMGQYRPIHKFP
jgi:hypothetical protein